MGLILLLHFNGGVFTYERDGSVYSIRRGERIVELCTKYPRDSIGLIGSDLATELGVRGGVMAPIEKNGQALRFALIAQKGMSLSRLQTIESPRIVSSYPITAQATLAALGLTPTAIYVKGAIEAELMDIREEFCAAFELVQSGDSVRDNNLQIIADDLCPVSLLKIGKGELV